MTRPRNDLEGINNEDYWPKWPFLPLKKKSDDDSFGLKLGVIHSFDRTRVVLTTIFQLPETWEEFIEMDNISYNSVEEMLEDGWVVD